MDIRPAIEKDINFIVELTQYIVSEKYLSSRQKKVTANYMKLRLKKTKKQIFIACENNQFLGYIDAEIRDDGTCYIARLAVHQNCRGAGVGQKLLTHIETVAKHYNSHKMVLETLVECKDAQRLYAKNNFLQEGLLENDRYNCDFIIMGKHI